MAGTHNPLLPEMATVIETVQETHKIKTFRVRFDDEEKMKKVVTDTGYTFVGMSEEPYEKKGLFSFLKK